MAMVRVRVRLGLGFGLFDGARFQIQKRNGQLNKFIIKLSNYLFFLLFNVLGLWLGLGLGLGLELVLGLGFGLFDGARFQIQKRNG